MRILEPVISSQQYQISLEFSNRLSSWLDLFLIEKHLFQLRNVDSYYDNFSRETVQFKITSLD